jgi:hypothetical protein
LLAASERGGARRRRRRSERDLLSERAREVIRNWNSNP